MIEGDTMAGMTSGGTPQRAAPSGTRQRAATRPGEGARRGLRGIAAVGLCLTLAACDDSGQFAFPGAGSPNAGVTRAASPGRLVERDVEAPEVFQVTEPGLWDGRPSLGGVWVAHPEVTDPERVIIRNRTNGKSVVGALFRRERENPGPSLQVSSDAAEALGLLPGAPAELNVTALRREEVAETPPAEEAGLEAAETVDLAAPATIEASPLDPIAGAAAAIDAAEAAAAASPAPVPAAAAAATPPATPAAASTLRAPYIQIGLFRVEANATAAADEMRAIGIVPTVVAEQSQGQPYYRVLIGPARTEAERAALLEKVKAGGYRDAYFVTE